MKSTLRPVFLAGFALALLCAPRLAGQPVNVNVTLASVPNPSQVGEPVLFAASLDQPVTGAVEFREGTEVLGTDPAGPVVCPAPCVAGAFFTTSSLSPGQHAITAHYLGDVSSNPAVSNTIVQVVGATVPALSGGAVAAFALLLGAVGVLVLRFARF